MILIDFSAICISNLFTQNTSDINEDFLRHTILNSLRMYNVKYRSKYGKMVICCDGGSWRKRIFPEYKAARSTAREKSDIDWDNVWRIINMIKEEIKENLPYKVVQVRGAEADDVIATLVETTQEFGCDENVMIVSGDKDFIQLQKYSNVSQFSPITKKLVTDKNPKRYLIEHVLRGCSGDGVPNVLSDDDTFIDETKRQKQLRSKQIEELSKNYSKLEETLTGDFLKRFQRNKNCIDFSCIPSDISEEILKEYESQKETPNSKVLNYLIMKRCKMLISSVQEFHL